MYYIENQQIRAIFHMFVKDTYYKQLIQSTRWRKLRIAYLREHPICEECGKLASQVHHRQPLMKFRNDLPMMEQMCFDEENLESVCNECHLKLHYELGKFHHRKEDIKNLTEERVKRFNEQYFEN